MKITPKQYAESLYEAISEKGKKEAEAAVVNFVNILFANNDASKINNIIDLFEKKWNKEEGVVEAEIISKEKLSSGIIKSLNDYIAKLSGAKKVIMNEKEDKNILGGVVIKYEDKIFDASLKTKLEDLNSNMIK